MEEAKLVAPECFQGAMARVAGAVSIVTVGLDDERTGLTVTSMVSVSLSPPSLLFCINRGSSAWPILKRRRCFGVNVLAAGERELAERFAGRTGQVGNERYEGRDWRTFKTGAPILADALVAFDCEIDQAIHRHTHEIIIGRVCATYLPGDHEYPLIYWRRGYEHVSPELSLTPGTRTWVPQNLTPLLPCELKDCDPSDESLGAGYLRELRHGRAVREAPV